MRHLSLESLIGFAEERLSPPNKLWVEEHIANCAICFAEASEWRSILNLMKLPPLESAPEYAIRNCLAMYQISETVPKDRVFATVLFDSALAAAVGIRGGGECRQIVFRTGDVDIHLRIGGNPRVILGQVLQRQTTHFLAGVPVRVLQADQQVEATITDCLGEFRFRIAPIGGLRLQADLPSYRFIGDFTIEEEEIT